MILRSRLAGAACVTQSKQSYVKGLVSNTSFSRLHHQVKAVLTQNNWGWQVVPGMEDPSPHTILNKIQGSSFDFKSCCLYLHFHCSYLCCIRFCIQSGAIAVAHMFGGNLQACVPLTAACHTPAWVRLGISGDYAARA